MTVVNLSKKISIKNHNEVKNAGVEANKIHLIKYIHIGSKVMHYLIFITNMSYMVELFLASLTRTSE